MNSSELLLPKHAPSREDKSSDTTSISIHSKLWSKASVLTVFGAALIPIFIPFFHLGLISKIWEEYNFPVDMKKCSCDCWDTIFKGPYDRGPAGYKHVYFNITSNTFKIWSLTVFALLLLYESSKYILKLFFERQVRVSMLVLLLLSVYPHYYAWWSCFNYWNDDFYDQWNHQMFFSITEMISTLMVIHLVDRRVAVTSSKCLVILSVAVLHILASGFDQFVENVVRGNGMLHQVLRDVFIMVPDLFHVAVPLLELRGVARRLRAPSAAHVVTTRQFCASLGFITSMWLISRIL
ncbi:uncharacterized protein LOC108679496 [Hyalella azteca]|uniref:Uncharacterized protein LOC108679496 n=1 Tax=Hyalella azteca TaxID=294128 RepID=A0A8B7PBR8_HYAAZ|nr:uncharacterized protein LOC108679496 [Hyalella azteca]